MLAVSSNVSVADIVNTIRSTDITRYAALELRKALLNLVDKFYDAAESGNALKKNIIPGPFKTFFSALTNFKKITGTRITYRKNNDNILIKVMTLLQKIYYNFHHGCNDTPLHGMNSHGIYKACGV